MMKKLFPYLSVLLLAAALTSCSGGGGGGTPTPSIKDKTAPLRLRTTTRVRTPAPVTPRSLAATVAPAERSLKADTHAYTDGNGVPRQLDIVTAVYSAKALQKKGIPISAPPGTGVVSGSVSPGNGAMNLREEAETAGANGDKAIIAIYDDGNLKNGDIRKVIEDVHGADVFAPTPDSGFTYADGSVNPNDTHAIYVILTALAIAPKAQISFQNVEIASCPSHCNKPPKPSVEIVANVMKYSALIKSFRALLARSPKPDVMNGSFGGYSPLGGYNPAELRRLAADPKTRQLVEVLRQGSASTKTIFVFAAGNFGTVGKDGTDGKDGKDGNFGKDGKDRDDVSILYAGLPGVFPELEEVILAAVALKSDGTLADYSQKCGLAAAWCLAAPGYIYLERGTSIAAPMISGAFALAVSKFPTVGNVEIRKRLLTTADRGFSDYTADLYGQGRLSVAALLAPWGALRAITAGISLDEPTTAFSFADSRLTTTDPLGDGIKRAFGGRKIAAFDELDAPFFYKLGDLTRRNPDSLRSEINRFMDDGGFADTIHTVGGTIYGWRGERGSSLLWRGENMAFSTNRDPGLQLGLYGEGLLLPNHFISKPFSSPYLALSEHNYDLGTAASYAFALGDNNRLRIAAFHRSDNLRFGSYGGNGFIAEHIYRRGDDAFSLQGGLVNEDSRQLGNFGDGAFSTADGADTYFSGFAAHKDFGGIKLMASAYGGISEMTTPLVRVDKVISSSFSLGAAMDNWSLAVHQPLRAEKADAVLSYVGGRRSDRSLRMVREKASLTPGGRELAAELRWRGTTEDGGSINFAAIARRQPGHVKAAATAFESLIHFSKKF